jgi:hypothetical protein
MGAPCTFNYPQGLSRERIFVWSIPNIPQKMKFVQKAGVWLLVCNSNFRASSTGHLILHTKNVCVVMLKMFVLFCSVDKAESYVFPSPFGWVVHPIGRPIFFLPHEVDGALKLMSTHHLSTHPVVSHPRHGSMDSVMDRCNLEALFLPYLWCVLPFPLVSPPLS